MRENPKEYKKKLEKEGKINCGRCPYHKKENASKQTKNWKRNRKTKWRKHSKK